MMKMMKRTMGRSVRSAAAVAAWIVSGFVAAGMGASPVQAQEPDPGSRHQIGCLRGEPLPACRSFWLVEMQAHTPMAQTTRPVSHGDGRTPVPMAAFESVLEWNVGHMVNLSPSWAVGGALSAGTGQLDPVIGLKVRARRWMSEDWSVELQSGLLRTSHASPTASGVTADLRVNIRDQGAFYVRWDALDLPPRESLHSGYLDPGGVQQALSVGAAAGSVPALVGTGALGLGYLVLWGLYLATYS